MAIQPAVCVNCGGSLKVDDTDLNGFCECEFCHTPHKVIDIITIDGLPTVKSLMLDADIAKNDGDYEKAVKLYNEVIKIKPNCHEAWWGLYICNDYFDNYYQFKDKYGNSGIQTKAAIMQNTIQKYANHAIEFAPPTQATAYQSLIQSSIDYINDAQSGRYDTKDSGGNSGCYIATAVYGSYDCPKVLTLRRYRDDYLAHRLWGRLFIKFYYFISPSLVKHIKSNSHFGKCIRIYLDKKVEKLSL